MLATQNEAGILYGRACKQTTPLITLPTSPRWPSRKYLTRAHPFVTDIPYAHEALFVCIM